jgi:hypothetical protein
MLADENTNKISCVIKTICENKFSMEIKERLDSNELFCGGSFQCGESVTKLEEGFGEVLGRFR